MVIVVGVTSDFCSSLQLSSVQIRKQKETEFEVLNSTIKGWEGEVRFFLSRHMRLHFSLCSARGMSADKHVTLFVRFHFNTPNEKDRAVYFCLGVTRQKTRLRVLRNSYNIVTRQYWLL